MLTDVYHDSETTTYNFPSIAFPVINGLTVPANKYPDAAVTGIVIPLHLNSLQMPNTTRAQQASNIPIITEDGLAYGGQLVLAAAPNQPRLVMEGYIDTPAQNNSGWWEPQLKITTNNARISFGELIAMIVEGRAWQDTSTKQWGRLDPLWFRDPFGRVYNTPRILDFSAGWLEGAPVRNRFTMQLRVG